MQYQNVSTAERSCCPSDTVDWKKLPDRMIFTNIPDTAVRNNNITTTNSNIFTFIPKNLIQQFSKSANLYFIFVAILQSIRGVSVTNGQPLVLLPFSMVVTGVLLKDAYEEYSRYKKDWKSNNQSVNVLKNGKFQITTWQKLLIGDVIQIFKQSFAPCDFVVLQSSDSKGKCYVQTKNLDGQTNQKIKKIPFTQYFDLQKLSPSHLWNQNFQLKYEKPNPNLHHFNGNITIKQQVLPLTQSNIILRGSSIQTIEWVTGVCVYTGKQTKLSLNSVQFKPKRSQLDKQLGTIIIIVISIQIIFSILCATLNSFIQSKNLRELQDIPDKPFWMMMGSWWLIMSYFIPISLVVTLQLIRIAQAFVMCGDERMFAPMNNTLPQMNSSSVNQDLGQIKYIFSDKTGTLTSNIMNFKMMSIQGKTYGDYSKTSSPQNSALMKQLKLTNVDFNDPQFMKKCSDKSYQDFFKTLFLCHQIIVQNINGTTKYSSSSPDQLAFLNFCKLCGYQLLGEENRFIIIKNKIANQIIKYRVLAVLQFSSDRKRMSIIVQQPSGEITLYIKGADSLIIPRVKRDDRLLEITSQHIQNFSNNGLRTLILAKRQISEREFKQWNQQYHIATTSINQRQTNIQRVCQLIEINLTVIGATGIQDKLQDNVPETIQQLKSCGIIFYILTGDKRQTAVNIGRSCGIISKNTQIIKAPEDSTPQQFIKWTQSNFPLPQNSVLLLNATLPITKINIPLHSTICYRCTPTQKQNVVKSVKAQTDELTLAIGDGSNDVNMITVADVGISIRGVQGNDVTRVSDFVIGQFSLLAPLVLYYGREWYRKNAKFVNFSMLKNIYHVAGVIGFGGFSMFGAFVIYEPVIYHFFNTFFTIAASCLYALLDQDWSMKNSLQHPELLYSPGQKRVYFNFSTYCKTFCLGFSYGILTQYLVYFLLQRSPLNNGRISYIQQGGMLILFIIIFTVNIKVLLMAHVYHLILIVSVIGSIFIYFAIYLGFIWYKPNNESSFALRTLFTTPLIWVIGIVVCFVTLVLDFAFKKYSDYHKNMVFNQHCQFKRIQTLDPRMIRTD